MSRQPRLKLVVPVAVKSYGNFGAPLRLPTFADGCACPGCARRSWFVGRATAECAWCGMVLPV